MARVLITNGESGLNVRNALNSMTAELYGALPNIPIKLSNQTGAYTQSISADTWVERISITPQSGTPNIKIGTTLHGIEICDVIPIGVYLPVMVQQYFTSSGTLYFETTGGNCNLRIDVINPYIQ
jgi:hypothetical protein